MLRDFFMLRVFSVFLFFVYKLVIIDIVVLLERLFPLRIDLPTIVFYLAISIFQFLFFIVNIIRLNKKNVDNTTLVEYFSSIVVIMEIVALSLAAYFLFRNENEIKRLFFIFVATFLVHPVYYFSNNLIINNFINNEERTLKLRFFNPIFFYFICFLFPFIFILSKVFIEKRFIFFDVVIFVSIIFVNIFTIFLNYLFENHNIKVFITRGKIKDLKTLYLKNGFDRIKKNENSEYNFLNSDYLSDTIKSGFTRKGLSFINEDYEATIVSLRFNISIENYQDKIILENFCRTVGLFAREYDAFPVFCVNQFFLIFGFPVNYEHRNYNAIEVVERIIKDTGNIVNSQFEGHIFLYASVCEGTISPYLLNLKGTNYKDIYVRGSGINLAARLSAIAEANKIPLLISKELYEKMKTRVFIEKALKVKEKDGELLVYQVRL